ncbi:MAG: bifunctional 5,10-methylenetetrahydrofolate dehydrogenase/5,10-methenyltetrahydrofolate cyclohydrolase [Candidatus Omnitrophica bacterium]|nr:bifunctional 5,10-methylenetetrahydrofolate dehydrogenase/5,10-methenyltetrahydrofolate cyclohydrolase [Candidatus Omnitrophota bacterium]MBU1932795.1 bifunctional 5,10-methylenetetrahydrofolate dehydrogenase/5,10-methenyltetrahydrofolate cyclohydrolase [Candidatus Omnitrophota bacterium]
MAAKLLDGKALALKIKEGLLAEINSLRDKRKNSPRLVSVQVGENPASEVYLKSQRKNAEALGIDYSLEKLDAKASQDDLIKVIDKLSRKASVSGLIVQMPLPQHIDAKAISRYISPLKDVEAVHPQNMGEIVFGRAGICPCTAAACMELLNSIDSLDLYGKEAVVVGHSEIVGKPLALLLLNKFVTTTVCHIATGERGTLPDFVKRAEILIVACGKPGLIKGDWIKEGAIVIDVGINRVDGKIVGDVEFDRAQEKASYITPVPGGVGPLTVAMLMKNVVEAFKLQA